MELTFSGAAQTVNANAPIIFSDADNKMCCVNFRSNSGIATLRGITSNRRARYYVTFNGNIAIPTGGDVGEISVALAIAGEPLTTSVAKATPAAATNYFNVTSTASIDVERGCCVNVSVVNTSTGAILADNVNLVVERVA